MRKLGYAGVRPLLLASAFAPRRSERRRSERPQQQWGKKWGEAEAEAASTEEAEAVEGPRASPSTPTRPVKRGWGGRRERQRGSQANGRPQPTTTEAAPLRSAPLHRSPFPPFPPAPAWTPLPRFSSSPLLPPSLRPPFLHALVRSFSFNRHRHLCNDRSLYDDCVSASPLPSLFSPSRSLPLRLLSLACARPQPPQVLHPARSPRRCCFPLPSFTVTFSVHLLSSFLFLLASNSRHKRPCSASDPPLASADRPPRLALPSLSNDVALSTSPLSR